MLSKFCLGQGSKILIKKFLKRVAVYDKLNSSKPWVCDMVYETLCFGLKVETTLYI